MFVPIIIIRFHVEFASPQYPSIKCGRCCNSINLWAETLPTLTMQVVSCRPISWCLPGVVRSQPLIEDILKAIEVNNLVTYNSQLLHQAEFRLSATLDHHLKMRFWAQTIKVSEGCCGFCPWNTKCHHLSSASFQPTDFWPRLCKAFTLFWCYLSPFLTLWIYHSARWPADPWINPRLEKKTPHFRTLSSSLLCKTGKLFVRPFGPTNPDPLRCFPSGGLPSLHTLFMVLGILYLVMNFGQRTQNSIQVE